MPCETGLFYHGLTGPFPGILMRMWYTASMNIPSTRLAGRMMSEMKAEGAFLDLPGRFRSL